MYRHLHNTLQVFLVHPGGPFWARKDEGAWTLPKGEYTAEEEALDAAQREFREETGFAPVPPFLALGHVRQGSGKIVHAWAFAGDCDPAALVSNDCKVEWPPRSGRLLTIPEVDRGAWFAIPDAGRAILKAQQPFLDTLAAHLAGKENPSR